MTGRRPAFSAATRATARRLSWGLGDQAVSSLTNFTVGIFVARSLGATAFGIFSLAWVTYGVVLNISRGLTTDPLVVRFSAVPTTAWREAVARTSGTAALIGVLAGGACVLVGLALGDTLGAGFIALGLVLPGLLLQDSWRYAFFAAGQGRKAFANDLVWGLALIPAMILAAHHGTVFGFVLAWGLAGGVAAAFGCLQTRILPRPAGARSWLRQQRDLGTRYLIENVSSSGASQIRAYGLGAIAGLASVGTVRGAELLLGPFLAVLMGLSLVAVPEAARVLRRSRRRLPLFCLLLGGGQAAAALLWGLGLLFFLPDGLGERLLGSVWEPASALIVPATISVMNASFSTGAAAGLRALGAARRSLRAQLISSGAYATGGLVGAAMGGALGSAWGVSIATGIGAVVTWWQLRAGLRDLDAGQPAEAPSDRPTDVIPAVSLIAGISDPPTDLISLQAIDRTSDQPTPLTPVPAKNAIPLPRTSRGKPSPTKRPPSPTKRIPVSPSNGASAPASDWDSGGRHLGRADPSLRANHDEMRTP